MTIEQIILSIIGFLSVILVIYLYFRQNINKLKIKKKYRITRFKDKRSEYLRIQYRGDDKNIDTCECIVDKRYATYNLIKELIENIDEWN